MHFMGSGGFVHDAALIDQPLTGSPLNFLPPSLKAELQAARLRHSPANIAVTIIIQVVMPDCLDCVCLV